MARIVFGTLTFLLILDVISGCAVTSGGVTNGKASSGQASSGRNSGGQTVSSRSARGVDSPIAVTQGGLGILLRPRNIKVALEDTQAEKMFREMDASNDGMVDAAEWTNFSKETSIWGFVELLKYADINDDEKLSLKEFLTVQVVKMDQSEDERDTFDVTP